MPLREPIGFAVFSAGSTLGLRVPNLRQRVFDSLDSLHLIRGVGTFLRKHIGLVMFSAGSTLGLKCGSRTAAAPDCAKESKVEAALRPLWTLLI